MGFARRDLRMLVRRAVKYLIFIFLPTISSVAAVGQPGSSPPGSAMPLVHAEKYVLTNGLQVVLYVDRKLPIVHVNVCYHVGSKDEQPGSYGFAHLFEHLMFQGSKNAPGKYLGLVEEAGANLFQGGVNGNTEEDRTNYFESVPSGNLEYVLWLESDRMATLANALTQKEFENQRKVVKNELQLVHQSRPYGRALTLMYSNLFPFASPYAHHPIGNEKDLDASSLDEVKTFFQTYYTPNNASLVIAGDFDPQSVKQLVEKYFSNIPTGVSTPRLRQWVTRHNGKKIIDVSDHVGNERTYLAWSVPGFFDKGDAELDLISLMLTDGISSRLNKALIDDQKICLDISSDHSPFEGAGIFSIAATAKPGEPVERIEGAVIEQLVLLAQKGPDPAELARAKDKWQLRFFTQLERIGGFGGKADLFNKYNAFLGNPNMFAADIERHSRITAQEIKKIAGEWLSADHVLLLRFHPVIAHNQAQVLDRSTAPALGANPPFNPPDVRAGTLQNGLTVLVVERHDLPKISVSIGLRAGSAFDPPGKYGLARFTVEAMERGTGSRSAVQVEDELGDVGTSLEAGIDRDYSALRFEVLDRNLERAIQVFADVVQAPKFLPPEVAREKQTLLKELREFQNNGQTLAALLAPSLIFGSDHPYGHPAQGLPSGIQKIERSDLVEFHAANWTPRAAVLVFAGNINFSIAMHMAEKYFSQWPDKQPPSLNMAAPIPADASRVYVVNAPGSPQAFIRQVLLLPGIDSPDYAAIQLADTVWGGGSAARLNLNLREDKGYAFSVFSHAFFYPKYGDWQAYGSVQVGKVGESVVEFLSELKGLAHDSPITAEELSAAQDSRVRGYAQQFESLDQVVRQVVRLWADGLPLSQLSNEIPELQRVDLPAVKATANKYAVPNKAVILIVGDLVKIAPQLRNVYGDKVTLLDSEGNPTETTVH